MAKLSKNVDKNNRKLTDFFTRTSSQITRASSPISQPPPSSQPGPSSSQPRSSQQTMAKPTTSATQRRVKAEKNSMPPGPDKEVISLSSDSGPIVISSDTAESHISISSGSTSKSRSVVDISTPISPRKPKLSVRTSDKQPVKSMATKTRKQPIRSVIVKAESSAAKTTIKRRQTSIPAPPLLNLPKATRAIKRKCNWESSSSSSEDSDGRIYIPKPNGMKPSLAHAPVMRVLAKPAPPPSTIVDPTPSSPLTNLSLLSVRSKSSRSSKRIRLDTSEPLTAISGNDADDEELVPSSQSDEQELTIPKKLSKDPEKVKNSVNKWRRESSVAHVSPSTRSSFPLDEVPATPPMTSPAEGNWTSNPSSPVSSLLPLPAHGVDRDGDVRMAEGTMGGEDMGLLDVPTGEGISQTISEGEVEHQLDTFPSASSSVIPPAPALVTPPSHQPTASFFDNPIADDFSFHPLTPPLSEEPLKPRVVAINAAQKTAMMIEKMKAEAAARAAEVRADSDDEAQLEFKELEESDTDEEMKMVFTFGGKGKGKAPAVLSKLPTPARSTCASSPEVDPLPQATQRYALRRRSSPQPAPSCLSSPEFPRPKLPAKKVANPLDKLLREKKTAEKKGGGMDGLRAAEAVLASAKEKSKKDKGKGKMRAEMDAEESSEDWQDEDAAMHVIARNRAVDQDEDEDEDEDEEGEEFAVDAATRLLEGDEGKKEAVNRILERDRKSWLGKKRAKKVVRGVGLWDDSKVPTQAEKVIPEWAMNEGMLAKNGTLRFLQSIVTSNEEARLSRCLLPQMFSTLDRADLLSLVPWLTSLILSSCTELLAQRAMAIITFVSRRCTGTPHGISSLLSSCLRALGAKEDSLVDMPQRVEVFVRSSLLLRGYSVSKLLQIVGVFIRNRNDTVANEEIPDLITCLLLVGLDLSTSSSLRTEIAALIDTLTARIPSNSDGVSDMEPTLCARLYKLASGWNTMNKSFMLSLLRGGSPQIVRISRWLGYCLLLGSEIPGKREYFALPSLHSIIKLLTPSPSTQPATVFDVMKNADKDDFCEQLSYNIEILEVVLYDIESYVEEEKHSPHNTRTADNPNLGLGSWPGSPEKEKGESELEVVVELLQKMHGKINDARAGDLERSKVKASLQYCWSRIHYQRVVALKAGSASKPRNLKGYFPRPMQRLST
ncbi:hypothetical protein BDY19DRAFT_921876 [Irpex rosettiformis]|uniref:Uncharacterized protein n=1 Tax=Irpex rosettiformis TaxID=378272 RepID=A0ACB8UFE0_9APHY|nr:hypothetical protein BDY19DRAFT_921876 [Irpex rosettiformis]